MVRKGFSLGDQDAIIMFSFAQMLSLLPGQVYWDLETVSVTTSDYCPASHLNCDMSTKEALALANKGASY